MFLFLLIFSLSSFSLSSARIATQRHLLHQPFFPVDSYPPTQPPLSSSPQSQPQKQPPKFPYSSSSSSSTPQKPFFPSYHSSPPPPSSSILPTFPANISTLLFPQSSSPHHRPVLAIALTVSFLSAAVIAALAAFFYYFRKNRSFPSADKEPRSDSLRLYPSNISTSDGSVGGGQHKPCASSNDSSEFLYLGTLVSSRGVDDQSAESSNNAAVRIGVSSSPYQKLGSPELKPLPPLPRNNFVQKFQNNEVASSNSGNEEVDDEEEEFFSPRGSSAEKETRNQMAYDSRRVFESVDARNYGRSRSLHSSSASPMNTVSNTPSPNLNLSPTSFQSKSPDSVVKFPAPLRPLPPRTIPLSLTSLSSSSSSSPSEKDLEHILNISPARSYDVSEQKRQHPTKIEPIRPPPPPPPPPRRFWEIQGNSAVAKEPTLLTRLREAVESPSLDQSLAAEQSKADGNEETPKPKLKPLHWDKVRASSNRAMVWDQIKPNTFQLNEEMIETLFVVNNSNLKPKGNGGRPVIPQMNQENRVLDPKKSQNIAILLRALNVTMDEVFEALLEGNSDALSAELLESLLKMAPTKEEELKLKEFKDESPFKLGQAEKFLKTIIAVPFAFKRVDAILYIANFDTEIDYLKRSFETLEEACKELRNSRMFLRLLEAVLKTGNRMNTGTNRGDAHAFKLDTLLKLVDVKGTDGKTTLLHFVVQEIIRAEGSLLSGSNSNPISERTQQSSLTDDVEFRKLGLQVVSSLSGELCNVKKAAAMDSEVLSSDVAKLARGITKVVDVVKLNEETGLKEESGRRFSESMKEFLNKAEEEIVKIQAQESAALSYVKEITEYFHGNSAKEEAHPFRIFTVVRDFLSILDRVCKEVGKINERTIVGSAHQFMPVYPIVPPSNIPGCSIGKNRQCDNSDHEILFPS